LYGLTAKLYSSGTCLVADERVAACDSVPSVECAIAQDWRQPSGAASQR
jgi:hypothetical protein